MLNTQQPILPPDEKTRVEELYAYEILDSAPETSYNDLVELMAQICECPLSAITFVDKDRQWFKAICGDKSPDTSRETSFCTHTILSEEALVVEDAEMDSRFKNNPDVTGGLGIRFYAGVPIFSANNKRLGAVCVIDTKPKKLTKAQLGALKLASKQVTNLLEMRLRNKILRAYTKETLFNSEKAFEVFFNDQLIPKWIYDLETLKFLHVNEPAQQKYGYSREEFLQMNVYDIRTNAANHNLDQLLQKRNGNEKPFSFQSEHRTKKGDIIKVEVTVTNILYKGKPARIASALDITEKHLLKEALQAERKLAEAKIKKATFEATETTQDFIARELHDNINQLLAATRLFLELAEKEQEMKDALIRRSKESLGTAIEEIRKLSKSLATLSEEKFLFSTSLQELADSYALTNAFKIHLSVWKESDRLPYDLKVNLFRIIQEQLNNIAKYASATDVWIEIKRAENLVMNVEDNGTGFDPQKKRAGIGINNIQKRTAYYQGVCQIVSSPGNGTILSVEIPMSEVILEAV